jgi:hypothetical protein
MKNMRKFMVFIYGVISNILLIILWTDFEEIDKYK